MFDLKKWINKVTNNMVVTTPTISISTSTGLLSKAEVHKVGNVVQVGLTVQTNGSVASGDNIYAGTINTVGLRPIIRPTTGAFYGAHSLSGYIRTDGYILIRNSSSTAVSITGGNSVLVSFTYIVE